MFPICLPFVTHWIWTQRSKNLPYLFFILNLWHPTQGCIAGHICSIIARVRHCTLGLNQYVRLCHGTGCCTVHLNQNLLVWLGNVGQNQIMIRDPLILGGGLWYVYQFIACHYRVNESSRWSYKKRWGYTVAPRIRISTAAQISSLRVWIWIAIMSFTLQTRKCWSQKYSMDSASDIAKGLLHRCSVGLPCDLKPGVAPQSSAPHPN